MMILRLVQVFNHAANSGNHCVHDASLLCVEAHVDQIDVCERQRALALVVAKQVGNEQVHAACIELGPVLGVHSAAVGQQRREEMVGHSRRSFANRTKKAASAPRHGVTRIRHAARAPQRPRLVGVVGKRHQTLSGLRSRQRSDHQRKRKTRLLERVGSRGNRIQSRAHEPTRRIAIVNRQEVRVTGRRNLLSRSAIVRCSLPSVPVGRTRNARWINCSCHRRRRCGRGCCRATIILSLEHKMSKLLDHEDKKSTVDMNPERALQEPGVAVEVDKTAQVLLKQQREQPG
jgi:hypothetical protein